MESLRTYLLIGMIVMSACLVTTAPLSKVLSQHPSHPSWFVVFAALLVVIFWPAVLLFAAIAWAQTPPRRK